MPKRAFKLERDDILSAVRMTAFRLGRLLTGRFPPKGFQNKAQGRRATRGAPWERDHHTT